jgi:hypothetical protein
MRARATNPCPMSSAKTNPEKSSFNNTKSPTLLALGLSLFNQTPGRHKVKRNSAMAQQSLDDKALRFTRNENIQSKFQRPVAARPWIRLKYKLNIELLI